MSLQDAQTLVLGTHLRAFCLVHPKITPKKLKIADEALMSCGMGTSIVKILAFWQQVPETVWLRLLAMRLLSVRPTCCPAQRTWDVFSGALRRLQCPVGRNRTLQLLHTRMNLHLLPHMEWTTGQNSSGADMETLFETVAQIDIDEEVTARAHAARAHAAALAAIPSAHAAGRTAHLKQRSDDDSACTDDY